MKTIALISLIILAGLLLVPTSQAAPSCCDPKQAQGQVGMFSPAPLAGGAFPVAPKSPYMQPVPQTTRATAPGPGNIGTSQQPAPYYPVPVVPVQAVSVNPPIAPVAAAPGPCGCGTRFKAAGYPAPSESCCSGRGLNAPQQAVIPSGSVPSCCAGPVKPTAPVSSCCAGKVNAAPSVPNCCSVGPKTAASKSQVHGDTGRVAYSYLPLQAQPAVSRTDVQPSLASAMKVPSNGGPVLRFGSLW